MNLKILFVIFSLLMSGQLGATIIDFNDKAGTDLENSSFLYGDYYTRFDNRAASIDGFNFTANQTYLYAIDPRAAGHTDSSYSPYNDSDYLMGLYGLSFSTADRSTFSLYSLDLGVWGNSISTSVSLTAFYQDGSTATVVYTMDNQSNMNDQDGSDFENILLQWENLASVSIQGSDYFYAVDNINTTAASTLTLSSINSSVVAIPLPSTLPLLLAGLLALPTINTIKKRFMYK